MSAKNKFYKVFFTEQQYNNHLLSILPVLMERNLEPIRKLSFEHGLDTGTTFGIDMAIIALGRMATGYGIEKNCDNCYRFGRSCIPDERIKHQCEQDRDDSWLPKTCDISSSDFIPEFAKQIAQAASDYGDLFDQDAVENKDDDLWWSGAKLDEELYRYVSPDIWPSFDERYHSQKLQTTK